MTSAFLNSLVFDPAYYLARYADLNKAFSGCFESAKRHWLNTGINEGRQGSHSFDPRYYLQNNSDLSSYYGNKNYSAAINHFLGHGLKEGRRGTSSSSPSAQPTPPVATIYEHSNYGGKSLQLHVGGVYDYSFLLANGFNDSISSLKLANGSYMEAYTDPGLKGFVTTFGTGISYIGDDFNDRISSIRIVAGSRPAPSVVGTASAQPTSSVAAPQPAPSVAAPQPAPSIAAPQPAPSIAAIFEHPDFTGKSLRFTGEGTYDYSHILANGLNDFASSVQISPGYYIEAYADPGLTGARAIFTQNKNYIGAGFDDKISSLRIVKGTPREIKQAVWNKSGFVLGVDWIDPVTGNLVKSDRLTTGFGSYSTSPDNAYKANLWIWGEGVATAAVISAVVVGLAATGGIAVGVKAGAAAGMAAFGGVGTTFGTLAARLSGQVMEGGISESLKVAKVFWSDTPSLDGKHLDVWGTVWNPQVGSGGSL